MALVILTLVTGSVAAYTTVNAMTAEGLDLCPGHRLSLHELNVLEAPSLEELDALAADAYARLPKAIHDLTGNIIIRVEAFQTMTCSAT